MRGNRTAKMTALVYACVAGAVAVGLMAGCGGGNGGSAGPVTLSLTPIAQGFDRPLFMTWPDDGTFRRFVVEQSGRVRIVQRNGAVAATPFLDLSGVVSSGNESGLLGLAFHPRFGLTRRVYVYFTSERDGPLKSFLSEFRTTAGDANRIDPTSERVLLAIDQPSSVHNGGMLAFGPDGMLYLGVGEGGAATRDRVQDLSSLLGKILRIAVDGGQPYGIPGDNPFAGQAGRAGEIWAYGFRNPWRFSFERATGRMFIGDVGQRDREEIDLGVAGGNFGWPLLEGSACYPPGSECDPSGTILPISEYTHAEGCSVTGGYVYRGIRNPGLRGIYLFADYCQGTIWLLQEAAGVWQRSVGLDTDLRIASFGEDWDGEVYVVDIAGGGLYRVDVG